MNAWTITCLSLGVLFGILAVIFALLKEKGATLISGFNTLPEEDKERYDVKKMSQDMRNSLFLWSVILLLGAILSYSFSRNYGVIAIFVWTILFLKDVHISTEKAFGKYRKQA